MKLTIGYIEKKFELYNKLYFNNYIKYKPKFKISHSKCRLGLFCCRFNLISRMPSEFEISVSDYYDRTEKQYDNTIIHEMIHMYLAIKYKRNMKHGYEFKAECHRINNFGWSLSARTDTTNFVVNNKQKMLMPKSLNIAYFKEEEGTYFLFGINDNYIDYYAHEMALRPEFYRDYKILKTTNENIIYNLPKCRGGLRGRRYNTKEELLKAIA